MSENGMSENGMSESEWQERAAAVYLRRMGRPIDAPETSANEALAMLRQFAGTGMRETMEAMRRAWTNYVFTRAGLAPGAGMAVKDEATAYARLAEAVMALCADWDEIT